MTDTEDRDLDQECDCPCHEDPDNIDHDVACCIVCLHCGRRIATSVYRQHVEKCRQRKEERG